MTETPERDMEAIRRRARQMAIRMGHRKPDPVPEPVAPLLPKSLTDHPGALRGMLLTGRLNREQEAAARAFLADLAAKKREAAGLTAPTPEFPKDAA